MHAGGWPGRQRGSRALPVWNRELYLRRGDAAAALARAVDGGGRLLDGLRDRSWGEQAGYLLDPDGHVLALAAAAGPADESH